MFSTHSKLVDLFKSVTKYEFTPAGGCVRDVLFGAKPKDYDLILCLGDELEGTAHAQMQDIFYDLEVAGLEPELYLNYGDEGSDFNERLFGCIKVRFALFDVDLLFSKYETVQDAVENFDCNINQCWVEQYHDETQLHTLPAFSKEKLEFVRPVSAERKQYIEKKFSSLILF